MDRHATRTHATFAGSLALRGRLVGNQQGLSVKRGGALEEIAARKFAEATAAKGKTTRTVVTHGAGRPTDPADIELIVHGQSGARVQVKASRRANWMAAELSHAKYDGMQKVVPCDRVEEVRKVCTAKAERARAQGKHEQARRYEDTARRVSGNLEVDGVSAGATRHREADIAAAHTNLYAGFTDAMAIGREGVARGVEMGGAAAGSAMMLGAARASIGVFSGKTDPAQAARSVGAQTIDAGRDGAIRGGVHGVIRAGADRANLVVLADSQVAFASANMLVNGVGDVRTYLRGESELEDLASALGVNAMSAMWGLYGGAAVTTVLGPGLPAAFVAYVTFNIATQAITGLNELRREADWEEAEADRVRVLMDASMEVLQNCERELQDAAHTLFADNQVKLESAFEGIDQGLNLDDHERIVEGLTAMASLCGSSLHLARFPEFDDFMLSEDGALKL